MIFLERLTYDLLKNIMKRVFSDFLPGFEDDDVINRLYQASERATKAFFDKYKDQFGPANDSFLSREVNFKVMLNLIFVNKGELRIADFNPKGYGDYPEATQEACQFFIDSLKQEISTDRVLVDVQGTINHYRENREGFADMKEAIKSLEAKINESRAQEQENIIKIFAKLIAKNYGTEDTDILRKLLKLDSERKIFQHGKINIYIENSSGTINIGDKSYEGTEADKIRQELKDIFTVDPLETYRKHLREDYNSVWVFQTKSFSLKDIYVSLRLEANPRVYQNLSKRQIDRLIDRNQPIMEQTLQECSTDQDKTLTIKEVYEKSNLSIILGEAGSGKTTLFKHLVATHHDETSRFMPVHFTFREWLEFGFKSFLEVYPDILAEKIKVSIPGLTEKLKLLWQKGAVMLLLDGLDEIDKDNFNLACQELAKMNSLGNKILVICRKSSFPKDFAGTNWRIYSINPFNVTDREIYIKKYFGEDEQKIAGLQKKVAGRLALQSLGQIPFLMGLICYLYEVDEDNLPEARAELYEQCVDQLLKRRKGLPFSDLEKEKKLFLEDISGELININDENDRLYFTYAQASELLSKYIREGQREEFLEEIVKHNSILFQVGADTDCRYCFPHRSFQEYFAACYLKKRGEEGFNKIIETLAVDNFWVETICLYAGMVPDVTELINCIGKQSKVDLALRIIMEARGVNWDKLEKKFLNWKIRRGAVEKLVIPEVDKDKLSDTIDLLKGILSGKNSDPNGNVRYSALIALERIGTPQTQELVDSTHIIPPEVIKGAKPYKYQARGQEFSINQPGMPANMVLVPGGTLVRTFKRVPIEAFYMSIFPVTNWEFRKFLEASGNKIKPGNWGDPRFNQEWQPVVGVSVEEAEAYCRWLTEKHKCKDRPYRLPTEWEWEWAARGPGRDRYCFGKEWDEDIPRWDSLDEKSLTHGASRVNTVYKHCVSGFGLFDMSGNVWEWTSSLWKIGSYRVSRGGSWRSSGPADLRSASRCGYVPSYRNVLWGFRLVRQCP